MLYIISTPIGNLGDITVRAKEVLERVEYLLCEDTRNTGLMLLNLGIKNKPKLISFYDEVEEQKIPEVVKLLKANKEIGLVTDAGTPVISDPGYKLVGKCQKLGCKYTSIPGPSAVINALVLSGLSAGRFMFLGFLPKKSGERKKILEKYKNFEGAKIIYESPFRVTRLVEEIKTVAGDEVKVVVCREMTKKFEEIILGNSAEVLEKLKIKKFKGEVVVIFE
ncbi:MAG TPA: 16S rRNA (cytidine(1402)-2'-O)-methyltransferase [Candidatus Woesebacteria bacterium]|jgi:16S rRNA (cytidine1402-2'-O)-methyltransferase|nr:16S rRNA (cytidine(1402)-2'-O)-methyltransferase [Candidatus Shapirobacteria bacterium]HOR01720.1 16S rRNA (cytidine(1402)-2'-O)-methyltransferase [Candidatus Woesebacteria bacterium]